MEWQVLAIENGKALVITKNIIDMRAYNDKLVDVTWESCTLRSWLNEDFLNNSFTAAEKDKIVDTKVVNNNNAEFDTTGGSDTTDKVFLLSIDEANKYFSNDSARVAIYTVQVDGMPRWYR